MFKHKYITKSYPNQAISNQDFPIKAITSHISNQSTSSPILDQVISNLISNQVSISTEDINHFISNIATSTQSIASTIVSNSEI